MNYLKPTFDTSEAVFPLGRLNSQGQRELIGTAFAISKTLLCTAAHVTGGSDQGLAIIIDPRPSILEYQIEQPSSVRGVPVSIVAIDPIHDVCLLRVEDIGIGHFNSLGSADETYPGSPLTSFGYPHADSGRMVLTRRDITCAAKTLGSNPSMPNRQLVLNVFARPGESGAPVLNSGGTVVAMVKGAYAPGSGMISLGGIDPASLHATTHAVSAEYIKDMLDDHR